MCDFTHSEIDGGAGANVFVFETLPCPVLQSSGGHEFPVVVVSKSLLEVNTVVKKFPNTMQFVIASWIGRAANENVLDSARVEKSSSCAARFWKRSSSG